MPGVWGGKPSTRCCTLSLHQVLICGACDRLRYVSPRPRHFREILCGELAHNSTYIISIGGFCPLFHSGKYIFMLSSSMDKAPNPPTNWHTAVLVRYGCHYFIFSDSFNPSLKSKLEYRQTSNSGSNRTDTNTPQLSYLYCIRFCTLSLSLKGRIDAIWITGLGGKSLECQKTATIFVVTELLTGQVTLSDKWPTSKQGPYKYMGGGLRRMYLLI